MAAGLPPPALPSLYASCVRAAGLTAGDRRGVHGEFLRAVQGTAGVTVRTDTPEHFMDDLKKYGYIRAEQSVPLLLHSLPVWGRFTSGGDFSFFIAVTHPSFRFSKGGRENRPATEYFSRAI